MKTTPQELRALERAEFEAQVRRNTERDVADTRRMQHTWAMQQMLMKREWVR